MTTASRPWTIVVPVFNGAGRLSELCRALDALCTSADFPADSLDDSFDDSLPPEGRILFVDDGSTDGSWELIRELSESHSNTGRSGALPVAGVRLRRRRGQQSALLAGLLAAPRGSIITMDDDLSHPAAAIPGLLKALTPPEPGATVREGQMVYARPPRRPGGRLRRLLSRLHQLHLCILTGTPFSIRPGSFRSMDATLVKRVLASPASFPYLSAMALSLRPPPRLAMLPTAAWPGSARGRFSLSALLGMEASLALHYNGMSRLRRARLAGRKKGRAAPSVEAAVCGWIAESCGEGLTL